MNVRSALVVGLVLLVGCSGEAQEAVPSSSVAATFTSTLPAPTSTLATASTTLSSTPSSCVVEVQSGDSLGAIAARIAEVSYEDLKNENGLSDESIIHPGDKLDICVGNDVDDVGGYSRLAPDSTEVIKQQEQLNRIFANYSILELKLDGDSGGMTRQALCAARLGLGLPTNTGHLLPGSDEAAVVMNATNLQIPVGAPTWAAKWLLIDKTCQVIVAGEGTSRIVDIYPTSTGSAGFATRPTQGVQAFRYEAASDNDGWRDSSYYPAENQLNGNMYRPIYFNEGQAFHGANHVPPRPKSKGCARTFPWHQDRIIKWLGLSGVEGSLWNAERIGLTVAVQGSYRPLGVTTSEAGEAAD